MKKLWIVLLVCSAVPMHAADLHDADAQNKEKLRSDWERAEELFKKHRNPGIPIEEAYPPGYFDRFNQPLMTPAEILYEEQYVDVPGLGRYFYAVVSVSDYQCSLGQDKLYGIISGEYEGAVQAVANNFNMVDERHMQLIGDAQHGQLRFKKQSNSNMGERLRLAIRATLDKSEARAGDLPYIYLATSEQKKLCAILLPTHVQKEMPHDWVCNHESEEQCKTHSQRVLAHLAALAQHAESRHQGTHKALVLVPYSIRPEKIVLAE